ncbi:hypothetical protein TNCV_5040951 [Trichonephila clavipes]|nr:hypothetical protein TNCV_5040951 [Trichonephila clavipes]
MVLKANDRRTSCPCHDEFRGHRSDYVRQKRESGSNELKCETPSVGAESADLETSNKLSKRENKEPSERGCKAK